ncbi:hypothetical protein GCM10007856_17440 [Azospirillum oryzae]|nr:hypothetical protein GCM10007856_17440 [Azospirillum oryzae]
MRQADAVERRHDHASAGTHVRDAVLTLVEIADFEPLGSAAGSVKSVNVDRRVLAIHRNASTGKRALLVGHCHPSAILANIPSVHFYCSWF